MNTIVPKREVFRNKRNYRCPMCGYPIRTGDRIVVCRWYNGRGNVVRIKKYHEKCYDIRDGKGE